MGVVRKDPRFQAACRVGDQVDAADQFPFPLQHGRRDSAKAGQVVSEAHERPPRFQDVQPGRLNDGVEDQQVGLRKAMPGQNPMSTGHSQVVPVVENPLGAQEGCIIGRANGERRVEEQVPLQVAVTAVLPGSQALPGSPSRWWA